MTITLALTGASLLADTLTTASTAIGDLTSANQAAADLAVGAAEPPIRTGTLDAGLVAHADAVGFALTVTGPAADYAGYVHARRPFFTTALATQVDAITARYLDVLTRAVDLIRGA